MNILSAHCTALYKLTYMKNGYRFNRGKRVEKFLNDAGLQVLKPGYCFSNKF